MADTEALTYEKLLVMFQETRLGIQETRLSMQEWTDRQMQERELQIQEHDQRIREGDRQMEEIRREIREMSKATDKKIGELGNRFGELAEHLVAPSIKEKFNELKFTFEQMSQDIEISDASGRCIAEIDILLENGDTVIAVEVKAKPLQKDVDIHVNRMEILRRRADARNDKRKYQGAIAGAVMKNEVRDYAHNAGFYVIEQTGDTVRINMPAGFRPREW